MRKQYHLRKGSAGLRAWDVDRLVFLSKNLTPELLPIAGIRELDEPYWGGSMTCREVAQHAHMVHEADLTFPVILSSDGRIMDGMHRVLKALLAGVSHVPAVRFSSDPEPDYVGVDPDDLPYEEENQLAPETRDASHAVPAASSSSLRELRLAATTLSVRLPDVNTHRGVNAKDNR